MANRTRISKSLIIAIAVLGLLAPMVVAAGGAEEQSQGSELVTVRFHGRIGAQGDHFQRMADIFNEESAPQTEVKLELFPGSEYQTKLNTMIAGGTIGDAFWNVSIEGFSNWVDAGVYRPLDDLLEPANIDIGDFLPAAVESLRYDGKLMALPWGVHPSWVGLYYNKSMFDQIGEPYPDETWTYDDLVDTGLRIVRAYEGAFGFGLNLQFVPLELIIKAFEGDVVDEDGTTMLLGEPEAREALQFVSDMIHRHRIHPATDDVAGGLETMFVANQLAMIQGGFWVGANLTALAGADAWGIAPMPTGPGGTRGAVLKIDNVGIASSSQHPAAALQFLKLETSFEGSYDLWRNTGFPSARLDVLALDEVQADPASALFAAMNAEAVWPRQPANHRTPELTRAISSNLFAVWTGEQQLADVLPSLVNEGTSILQRPKAY